MYKVSIKLSNYDGYIFDMDGTMIDNMSYHKDAWLAFAKKYGQNLTEVEFKEKFSGKKNDQLFEMFFQKKLNNEEIKNFSIEKEAMYRVLYKNAIKEISGLTNVITTLQQQYKKIAIATTAPKENRDFGLKALNLSNSFSVILGDEHITKGKPDPQIYLEAAKKLGVTPDRCLVFEDSPPGVLGGKNAGMTVVALLTTHTKEELHHADFYIKDFTELNFV